MERLRLRPLVSSPVRLRRSWWERWRDRLGGLRHRAGAASPARDARRELGRQGEDLACRFLRRRGYQILERNSVFRLAGRRWMEFDLIAWEGGELVFIEVKTRHGHQPGFAAERAVHPAKRRRLLRGAREYRQQRNLTGRYRFDVVSVYAPEKADAEIDLLRDAFFPGRR